MDSAILEATWTFIPILILVRIAIPRITLLIKQDALFRAPKVTVKLLSNQWNWQREQYQQQVDHLLDSEKLDELGRFEYPLLLKAARITRFILSRRDVLHSLGIPSLGVKLDATPGRLNTIVFELLVPGLIIGSCYELCGSGHRAMPIYLLAV